MVTASDPLDAPAVDGPSDPGAPAVGGDASRPVIVSGRGGWRMLWWLCVPVPVVCFLALIVTLAPAVAMIESGLLGQQAPIAEPMSAFVVVAVVAEVALLAVAAVATSLIVLFTRRELRVRVALISTGVLVVVVPVLVFIGAVAQHIILTSGS